jgi:uncharacterized protein (DUF427 family)
MKAIFNKTVIAQSSNTVVVEGNYYFPLDCINSTHFTETAHHSSCPWKGEASYYTIRVNDKTSENAAWIYKKPKDAAQEIKNHVAFSKNILVEE